MDDQFTLPSLTRAISNVEIEAISATLIAKAQQALVSQASSFLEPGITPLRTHGFECQMEIIVRELGRSFLEWCFGAIEPESVESMPGVVRFNHSFRRLIEKTMHSNILTRFGNIGLSRATYRRGRAGKVIAPVEKMLGIKTMLRLQQRIWWADKSQQLHIGYKSRCIEGTKVHHYADASTIDRMRDGSVLACTSRAAGV